jgi:hypothetical protein
MNKHLPTSIAVLTIGTLAAAAALSSPGETPSASKPEQKVEMLFVQSAKGASLANGKLTLHAISPTTVFFSDRPSRIAGHMTTDELIALWGEGKNSFLKDPPNATLSSFTPDGKVTNAVVELKTPALQGEQMTYNVRVLQGKVPEDAQAASLFIDVVGMPLTPVSYAGAARRAERRAIVYH